MALGFSILGWDNKCGALKDFMYPESFNMTENMINKIHMAHSLKEDNFDSEELIEINYEDKIILSYCDKSKVKTAGYEEVVLVIHQRDKISVESLKSKLMTIAREIIKRTKNERNKYALDNMDIFFKKITAKKILILGRAGTGKSSIKEVVFEGKNPKDLIYNPLAPTRGLLPMVYSWLDLKLGVFDSSGQELINLLKDENEQSLAFKNADVIIYLIDFPMWVVQQENILEEIKEIKMIRDKKSFNAKIILFFHKIDLINMFSREERSIEIREIIYKELELPVYFTSLYPELIFNLYNAFYEIIVRFSGEAIKIKKDLDSILKDLSKTMFFITNKNQSIICQASTKDFDYAIINHFHNLTAQLNQNFKDMCLSDNIRQLILVSEKELKIYMRFLNLMEYDLMNLICVSETLDLNHIFDLTKKIMLQIAEIYQ